MLMRLLEHLFRAICRGLTHEPSVSKSVGIPILSSPVSSCLEHDWPWDLQMGVGSRILQGLKLDLQHSSQAIQAGPTTAMCGMDPLTLSSKKLPDLDPPAKPFPYAISQE